MSGRDSTPPSLKPLNPSPLPSTPPPPPLPLASTPLLSISMSATPLSSLSLLLYSERRWRKLERVEERKGEGRGGGPRYKSA